MNQLILGLLLIAGPVAAQEGSPSYTTSAGAVAAGAIDTTKLAADAVTAAAILSSTASLTKVSGGLLSIDGFGGILLSTGGSGNNDRSLYVSSSNWVVVGGTSPILSYVSGVTLPTGVNGGLVVVSTGATRNALYIASESNSVLLGLISNGNPAIDFYKSTGTLQNQQGIGAGASIMLMRARPIQSSGAQAALGQIQMKTSASGVTTGSYPSDIEISVTRPNATSQTVSYIGTSSGAWGIGYTAETSVSQNDKLDVNGSAQILGQLKVSSSAIVLDGSGAALTLPVGILDSVKIGKLAIDSEKINDGSVRFASIGGQYWHSLAAVGSTNVRVSCGPNTTATWGGCDSGGLAIDRSYPSSDATDSTTAIGTAITDSSKVFMSWSCSGAATSTPIAFVNCVNR